MFAKRALVGTRLSRWFGVTRSVVRQSGTAVFTAGTSTSMTVNAPAGIKDGDLLIVHIRYADGGSGDSITLPSGWTLLNASGALGSDNQRSNFYWKIAASEGSSWTWTNNTGSRAYYGVAVGFEGTDQTTPIDVSAFSSTTTSATSYASSSVTPTMDGCMLFFALFASGTDPSIVITPDGAFTEIYENSNGTLRTLEGETLLQTTKAAIVCTATSNEGFTSGTRGSHWGMIVLRPATTLSRL